VQTAIRLEDNGYAPRLPQLMIPNVCACAHLGHQKRQEEQRSTPAAERQRLAVGRLELSYDQLRFPVNSDVSPFNEKRMSKQLPCQSIPSAVFVNSLSGVRAVPPGTARGCIQFSGPVLRLSGRHRFAP